MNRSNIDIIVYNGRDSKLHARVLWGGERIIDYALLAKPIGEFTNAFLLCDITTYKSDEEAVAYIVMLSTMYLILKERHELLDRMVCYETRPNVVYGMDSQTAPFQFTHNDMFNATLSDCESLCGGENIDLVERDVDGVIIMKCEGMKSLLDTYMPSNEMLVHIRN